MMDRVLDRRLRSIEIELRIVLLMLAVLVDQGDDRAKAKALTADVVAHTDALREAIPNDPNT